MTGAGVTGVAVTGAGVASPRLGSPGDLLRPPAGLVAGFDPAALLGGRGLRYKDQATRLGLLAAARALGDAGLLDAAGTDGGKGSAAGKGPAVSKGPAAGKDPAVSNGSAAGLVPSASTGVVVSSNLGNLDTVCRTAGAIAAGTVADAVPIDLPNASSNVIASSIAIRFGLRGPNVMVCNGASSGLDAAFLAASLIAAGRVCRVVLVGVEPVNDVVENLAHVPAQGLFGGAAAVVLEPEASAKARGAVPRARLGRYARCASAADSAGRAISDGGPPGLWLASRTTAAPPAFANVHMEDLEAKLGTASGALGVLQVVAGTCWLADAGDGPVLATAGAAADGVSSLLLTSLGG